VARLSPLLHEHINMLRRYSFSVPQAEAKVRCAARAMRHGRDRRNYRCNDWAEHGAESGQSGAFAARSFDAAKCRACRTVGRGGGAAARAGGEARAGCGGVQVGAGDERGLAQIVKRHAEEVVW